MWSYPDGGVRQAIKFDTRTLSSPLPIGGYPSLLKQQLRDLVLRRKSLVREEPEDEDIFEAPMNFRLHSKESPCLSGTQLKTGPLSSCGYSLPRVRDLAFYVHSLNCDD